MDSVINANGKGSPQPSGHEHILDRLQRLAVESPELEEYQLTTELEAQELLLAMAAMIKHLADTLPVEMIVFGRNLVGLAVLLPWLNHSARDHHHSAQHWLVVRLY